VYLCICVCICISVCVSVCFFCVCQSVITPLTFFVHRHFVQLGDEMDATATRGCLRFDNPCRSFIFHEFCEKPGVFVGENEGVGKEVEAVWKEGLLLSERERERKEEEEEEENKDREKK